MDKIKDNSDTSASGLEKDKDENKEGYPRYSKSEDIYENYKQKSDVNPADISKTKTTNSTNAVRQKALDDKHRLTGKDLDVPGSELDDAQEATGNEDEENNYYSVGGDAHEDLEEDRSV